MNCGCIESNLPYLAWHRDADRRARLGQRQVFCEVCQKWIWRDHVGKNAVVLSRKQFEKKYALPR